MRRATRTRFGAVMALGLLLSLLGGGSVATAASRAANDARARSTICANQVRNTVQGCLGDSTTSVTTSITPTRYGQAVTFTATVNPDVTPPSLRPALFPPTPTGTVDFTDGATTVCGGVTLDGSAQATCTTHKLIVGDHVITATYNGDIDYNGSSGTTDQTVKRAGTRTIIGSSSPISHHGHAVIFSAFVFTPPPGGGIPTGKFQFGIDGVKFGAPVTIGRDGRAFLPPVSNLAVGQHRIGGTYLGDANHRPNKPVRLFQLVVK